MPGLAVEIGLPESIMLMQIDFWINQTTNERDGHYWTYQSARKMRRESFPFWSLDTINRTVHSLAEQHLILIEDYNLHGYDNTRWFAVNPEGIARLKAVRLEPYDNRTGVYENRTGPPQNRTGVYENRTTIPETTPETTPERMRARTSRANGNGKATSSEQAALEQRWAEIYAGGLSERERKGLDWGRAKREARRGIKAGIDPVEIPPAMAEMRAGWWAGKPLPLCKVIEAILAKSSGGAGSAAGQGADTPLRRDGVRQFGGGRSGGKR